MTEDSLILTNTLNGERPQGTITADGGSITWTLASHLSPLAPSTTYLVTVSPAVRGPNGTPLGTPYTFSFTTLRTFLGDETGTVDPTKIHITIPDETGHSTVFGAPGALPLGATAIATRRSNDFTTQYQASADSNGAFTFRIGDCTSPLASRLSPPTCDAVTIHDQIDLRVLNSAGNLIAIVPLTPFITEDQRGFIAPVGVETTFTTAENITITVPAGAFDQPTLVHADQVTSAQPFDAVPSFSDQVHFGTAIRLEFDCGVGTNDSHSSRPCVATKRLQLSIREEAGTDPSLPWLLGLLGESTRGPRLMPMDTIDLRDGSFTTKPPESTASAKGKGIQLFAGETAPIKDVLPGATDPGTYAIMAPLLPAGRSLVWAIIDSAAQELHSSVFSWMYVNALKAGTKGAAVPAISDTSFTISGVTWGGYEAFRKVYDPIAATDPGVGFVVPPLADNVTGPYPVFGSLFDVEIIDLATLEGAWETSEWTVTFANGLAKAKRLVPLTEGEIAPEAHLLNTSTGKSLKGPDNLELGAKTGHRLILVSSPRKAVDPRATVSVVFNEPIDLGPDSSADAIHAWLADRFDLSMNQNAADPNGWVSVGNLVRFSSDSAGRRITITPRGSLSRGALYRLTLKATISDTEDEPLLLGQAKGSSGQVTGGSSITLSFATRAPEGPVDTLTLDEGSLRDLELYDNLLFVAALEGGISAWDVTRPFASAVPRGYARAEGQNYHAVAIDRHGRVWTTGVGSTFGFLRSWRVSDFLGDSAPVETPTSRASAVVSWAPGASGANSSIFSSSEVEAIPRGIEVLSQDETESHDFDSLTQLANGDIAPVPGNEDVLFGLALKAKDTPYPFQWITVENVTRGMRWHARAEGEGLANFTDVVARPGEEIRIIYNQRTWAVINLFGYGTGVWDLNAVETNDSGLSFTKKRERLLATTAEMTADEICSPKSFGAETIPNLRFSPGMEIFPSLSSSDLAVIGSEVRKGVLDLAVKKSDALFQSTPCFDRGVGLKLFDHPMIEAIQTNWPGTILRFGAPARHSWRIEAADNAPVAPAADPKQQPKGRRGSIAGQEATRDYVLVPAAGAGLMVVEVGGTNRDQEMMTQYLADRHLVDVIWIPTGAYAVRAVAGSDLAVVIDSEGYAILVDLTDIDQRWTESGTFRPVTELFPTLAELLAGTTSPWAGGVGAPDSRIVWRSEKPVTTTTMPPVVDPLTGTVYAGKALEGTIERIDVETPRIRLVVDTGQGTVAETGGIIPLRSRSSARHPRV